MWIVIILQILDDLFDRGFIPNPNNYQNEMRRAGIFVERLAVAMAAVLHKHGRSLTWGKFWEVYESNLSMLPFKQKQEIHDYWFAGPIPGLAGSGDQPAPVIGNTGDWFVTDFSGTTVSVVVTLGFTAITGSMTFTRVDGTQQTSPIGVMGPSVGASVVPGGAKAAEFFTKRFPVLSQLFSPPTASGPGADLMRWLMYSKSAAARMILNSPTFVRIAPQLASAANKLAQGGSIGPTTLPSAAIGLVTPNNGQTLEKGDFSGECVMFSASGSATIATGGIYFLAFGLSKAWNPLSDPTLSHANGFAAISAASISAQIPNFGVSETLFWGEIT
jgi:hypothetical protein